MYSMMGSIRHSGYWKMILTAMVSAVSIGCGGCGAGDAAESESRAVAQEGDVSGAERGRASEGSEITPAAQIFAEYESGIPDEKYVESALPDTPAYTYQDYDRRYVPLLEQMFSFEENDTHNYIIITGIEKEYKAKFWEYMAIYARRRGYNGTNVMCIPVDINGLPVWVIGENAFADMKMDRISLPDTLRFIASGAFKNTGLSYANLPDSLGVIGEYAFENCNLEYLEIPDSTEFIGERAFAGNSKLWTVLISDNSTVIGKDAFADCAEEFLLCYGENGREKENLAAAYAKENGFESMEIVLSKTPIVYYHEEPLILQPRVDNFFYGVDVDEEKEEWCSWEYDENAPNFGYPDWQWVGCSSWCGANDFEQEVEASSELAQESGRYAVSNVTKQNREAAWAEGVEGNGIGESIIYRQSCTYGTDNKWEAIRSWDSREPEIDGFMRYTEICIVNGYAKDQKTWEENGRIKELLMYVENRPYAYLELEDTIYPQYFTLPEDDIKVLNGGMLEVRYEITQVYPGSLYEDTCLTGLIMEFSGRYAH